MKLRLVAAALSLMVLASCASRGRSGSSLPSPFPVATGDYPMRGHAADYSWISGAVERDLACTYLDFDDRGRSLWGGRIALDLTPDQTRELRDGDMVVVSGGLSRLAYGSCGAISYLVASIEEH